MKKILVGTLLASSLFVGTAHADHITLTDIGNSYAKGEIQALVENHYIEGYPDSTFKRTGSIKRVEFAVMLAKALELPKNSNACTFTDVPNWAKPYVGALQHAGLVNGVGNGEFGSEDNLKRQDLAVLFTRAMYLEELIVDLEIESSFADNSEISDYAKKSVGFLQSIGFIKGEGVNFSPSKEAERQAVARLMYEFSLNPEAYFDKIFETVFLYQHGVSEAVESAEFDFENGVVHVVLKTGETLTINIDEDYEEEEEQWFAYEVTTDQWFTMTKEDQAQLVHDYFYQLQDAEVVSADVELTATLQAELIDFVAIHVDVYDDETVVGEPLFEFLSVKGYVNWGE